MRVATASSRARPPRPVPRMIATSGTSSDRARGGGAGLLAQLLGRDQRLVHGPLPVPERPQLLAQRRQPLLQLRLLSQDALQLVGHAHPEVLHADRLVAAQRAAKLLLADVERRQAERVFAHGCLGPNRAVPNRIIVVPSSTAVA